ncbi:efflux RND transporter periplasmic adaptor subunit [Dichotomicrobium thermohalophilum]|uniref:HlyD family secretion protein n=1 Tax=Dichotomicrobium thermohalophilum TaxID=933063 RepID=A0A397Q2H4_9HYPH|nr:HlyD family efflux transporter periplasmic adaptor subunit [Dichotomicrobium thermohalophilum]RIA55258.1 HlyD family secretion protein [Dichotomicrobium thermohalophilum]
MGRVWRKRIAWAVLAAGAAALIAYGFWPDAVPVDTAKIRRGDVIVTVEDEGISQVREVYRVSSPVAGTVQRSPVEVGDEVQKGETIVASVLPTVSGFLDDRTVQMREAAVKAAQAQLRLAEAKLERAKSMAEYWTTQLERVENLEVGRTVTQRTVDETRMEAKARLAEVRSAEAEVNLREKELEQAKAALLDPPAVYSGGKGRCCLSVPAPESGVVLEIHKESETVVQAGAPLLDIGDPRDLEIVAELLSRDAVQVRVGARAIITEWGGPPLEATVRRVDRSGFEEISALGIEEQRVKVWLDIADPPEKWAQLGHDYRVIVRIVVNEQTDVLRVPVSALFRRGEDWAVFVREDDRARLRRIELGARNFDWAQVTDGLSEGDEVILYPSDRLSEGVRVVQRQAE